MATETTIKFRRGNGTPTVGNAFASNSVGEPLWDTSNEKLYVTNGTATPVLIGPGQVIAVEQALASGTHIATITIDGTQTQIYAPTSGSGDTSTPQILGVTAAGTSTPPTLEISNGNAVELIGTNDNTANQGNVTITVGGRPAGGTSGEEKAAIIFEANVSVIDGGSWDTANDGQ